MESTELMIYAGIAIIALLLYVALTSWAHQIQKRNRYLKAQTELLGKMAVKQGVSSDEVEVILRIADKSESIL